MLKSPNQLTVNIITAWQNSYTNFKSKDSSIWKTIFKMPFICSRHTSIQAFQYKIILSTLPCYEWLKTINIKSDSKCTFCNNIDSLTYFLIDCKSNNLFWKGWAQCCQSMASLNMTLTCCVNSI